MKIREGFVSNSSSSSFIIKKGKYKDAYELAERMIPCREWDDEDQELLNKVRLFVRKKKLNILNGFDEKLIPNVYFKSCNYDTFIIDKGETFEVSTCNNHDWDLWSESEDCPEYLEVPQGIPLYSLEIDDWGTTIVYENENDRWGSKYRCGCYEEFLKKEEGGFICPGCGKFKEEL